jgi:peptidyl-prolyl cis-trans isomerase A (cyclophilin A)
MKIATRLLGSVAVSLAFACGSMAMAQGAPAAPATPAAPAAPAAQVPAADGAVYVLIETSKGNIVLQLDPVKAPVTVANFMKYVKSGFYDNTSFHRIVPNFVVQGGGFDDKYVQKKTEAPIKNECMNGLKNSRGTISMARTQSPDSATSQFFLNLKDNPALDPANRPGYAVFGKIIVGMNVLDAMGAIQPKPSELTDGSGQRVQSPDVPGEKVTMTKASEIDAATAEKMMADAKAAMPATPAAPTTPAAPAAAPAAPAAPKQN